MATVLFFVVLLLASIALVVTVAYPLALAIMQQQWGWVAAIVCLGPVGGIARLVVSWTAARRELPPSTPAG